MAANVTMHGVVKKGGSILVNRTTVKKVLWVCDKKNSSNWITSQGLFLGAQPMNYSFPLLLVEASLIFVTSRLIHHFLRRLHQSRTVSYIVTGFILGPSVIGRSPSFRQVVFPPKGTFVLDTISLVSLIFFLFNISVKTDLSSLRKPSKLVLAIGIFGSVPPLLICCFIYLALRNSLPPELNNTQLILLLASRMSLSSFAVLTDILDELGLLNTELGRAATTTALVSDVVGWFLNAFITATMLASKVGSVLKCIMSIVSLGGYVLLVVFGIRPLILRAIKKTPAGELLDEGYFVGIIILALGSALATEMCGYHAAFGPIVLGLALPGGMPLGVTLSERLEWFTAGVFQPIYLTLAGFRTDFNHLGNAKMWGYLELIVGVTYVGKTIGSMAGPLYYKMPLRDALAVGLMMNLKGVIEVQFLNNWGDTELANIQQFSILMLSITAITATSTPLIRYLYKPSMRYITSKRRTVQHSKPNAELRVLVAVHDEDNVAPLMELLEVSNATKESPITLYVLHVTELRGRAAAVLAPHKRSKNSTSSPSDRIVNAFRYFEKQNDGAVSVHPFVALAPNATMHNDVCFLALDKKVRLIVLPFHKHTDGALATAKQARQAMNQNVLSFAPCSVAILVDHRHTGGATCARTNDLLSRVAVFFIGGPDDREALAIGVRMAKNPNIRICVVRFVSRGDLNELGDEQWRQDNLLITELRGRAPENVIYKEEVVQDGEGTVGIIRTMSDRFDLLIVGRRKGEETALTSGLSMWSECPELGIIGDMLSSTDFGVKVSILVVQQQGRAAANNGGRRAGIQSSIMSSTLSPIRVAEAQQ